MPRIQGNTFFNGCYVYVDYTIGTPDIANNRTPINWTLGTHNGNADIRYDNVQCQFTATGGTSGTTKGGPYTTGWPTPEGQNQDLPRVSGSFWAIHNSSGQCTVSVTGSCTSDFGSSSFNTNFALPQIPQSPISPSNASATRVNDSQINVSWTNNDSGTRPYANVKVYRRVNGGSWQLRATLGVVESYQDTSVSANNKYEYRMSALGVNGAEVGYATSNAVWTTPAAPSGCNASRLPGGNIRVTWTNNVNYPEYTTRVEVSNNEGVSWTEIGSASSGSTSFDHTGPPPSNDSYKYRVRARTSSGTTLNSGYSTQSGLIYADPAAPSSLTATRVNDNQASLSWTNNPTSEAPYKNIKVYRRANGGGYALIATLGVVTSYSDSTISPNNKYEYRVSAVGQNDVEVGFATAPNPVYTTPAANSNVSATKLPNSNIQITWTVNSNYKGNSDLQHDIYDSPDGANWTLLTTVFGATASYEHVAPNNLVTHRYRITSYPPGTTLFAVSNVSNIIQLLATANPPSNLSPSGVARDADEEILFTWTHNPADGTHQTKYRIQYEVDGGATQTIGPVDSGNSSHALAAGTLTNGHTITWRVATAGQNGTLSSNSSDASFITSARPTSVINSPSGTISESKVTAAWTYFQAQSSPQVSWHAFLYRNTGSGYELLEEKNGTTESEVTFATTVLDGLNYAVRVYVTSAAGLESIDEGTELQDFSVSYLPPAQVTLTPIYDADKGWAVVTIEADLAEPGVTEEIASIDLQRSINGGDWVTWITGLTVPPGETIFAVIDVSPTINGTNTYRALIHSALPSSDFSPEAQLVTSETRWGFLSTGENFSQVVRMRAELDQRVSLKRDKATYHFAGRAAPVELSGEHIDRRIQVTATLYGQSSTPQEMEELALTRGIVLWRDYTGRRMYASISDVQIDYRTGYATCPASFQLREVEYDENVG